MEVDFVEIVVGATGKDGTLYRTAKRIQTEELGFYNSFNLLNETYDELRWKIENTKESV